MELANVNKVYFLGIGGIGMSALARYFLWLGKDVSGYDRTKTDLTLELEKEGADINYEDRAGLIPENLDMIIYTPAIPQNSQQFEFLLKTGVPMYKRAHVLGVIAKNNFTIAVAGTHGKTTITTMLAHIFKTAGMNFMALAGGISTNYNTNFVVSGSPHYVIVEADEYDRSFLHLHPNITVITSVDADHLDVYGSMEQVEDTFKLFVKNLKPGGVLLTHQNIGILKEIVPGQQTYSIAGIADYTLEDITISEGKYSCKMKHGKDSIPVKFGGAGRHNLENALAAAAVSLNAGIQWEDIQAALTNYRGVKRRFEIILKTDKVVYIDDYAHHPREIKACIDSAIEMFPGRKITGVFQPHLFSRTKDFADGFAEALDRLDRVVVLDIYPARELPLEGVSARIITDRIQKAEKHFLHDNELLKFIEQNDFEVLITMGAGDIDKFVKPIKELLKK
ncbi:MAG: UDP-N-acetylmuramate--L-alanine ligase [Bacteroidetes bacterium]|nr:MAG: UDP-N-acetylmuramate--L-alanine ligase [Bacteroidota bacterium]